MKLRHTTARVGLFAFCAGFLASQASALEIITKEDFDEAIIKEEQLVRIADNAIFLIDTSSSMNEEFRDTGESKLDIARREFKERNAYFPEIGHRFGLYEYTPWKEVYPLQTYDREKVAAALEKLPEKGFGPTPLAVAMEKAEAIIKPLEGRTALFLFYDGQFTGQNPDPAIWRVTHDYDVCLIMVSSASEKEDERLARNVARLNPCSRLVRLEDYLARPEYLSNALFDVVATEKVVTTSQLKVGDVRVDNLLFDFDKEELTDADQGGAGRPGRVHGEQPVDLCRSCRLYG